MKPQHQCAAWLTGVLGSALLFGAGCSRAEPKKSAEREVRVTVQPLTKRTFRERIPVQGTVEPVEFATISAKICGTVELLRVDEGDSCRQGDVLFGIDRKVLKNQVVVQEDEIRVKETELEKARIGLGVAEISMKKAKLDYDRYLKLAESKAVSQSDLETCDTAYQKAVMEVKNAQAAIVNAEAQLKQAANRLAIAQKNLDDSTFRAPFESVVVNRFVEPNEYVSAGQNILKLENPRRLEVICHISAVHYAKIQAGRTPVNFTDGNKIIGVGKVAWKAPSIDPESRTFKLKIPVPQNVPAVSGALCDLSIVLQEKEAYGLPADALLLRANDRRIVYAAESSGRAKSCEVIPGIRDGGYCEIVNADALPRRKFVVTGQTYVNNGTLLRVVNAASK